MCPQLICIIGFERLKARLLYPPRLTLKMPVSGEWQDLFGNREPREIIWVPANNIGI